MSKRLTLHNPQREIQQFNHRTLVVSLLVGILALTLIIRLFYLQVMQHNMYSTLSRQNLLNVAPIDPNRGIIYDRNGVLLAENIPVFSLEISPDHVQNMQQTIDGLKQTITLSPTDIQEFYKQLKQWRRFTSIPLKVQLTDSDVAKFAVNQFRFPGVSVQAHLMRYYPYGAAMSAILGYVGRINAQEFSQVDQANYSGSNYIGKIGVEKYYETQLHGTVGIQQVETDAGGRVIREAKRVPAIPGNNLYLTIDSKLQFAAEKILGTQVGAVIAIDPRNGEVLAFVSNPSFDPNLFVTGISNQQYQALQKDPGKPLYNRALRGLYSPGSTIKPYMAVEALASGTVTPRFTIHDPGWFKLPGASHIYHDWKKGGHGTVNMESAIIQSCDTYFFTIANLMGITKIDNILNNFGFGQLTQIDSYGEIPGLAPSPSWKQRAHHDEWYPGDTVNIGVGQGYLLITPLQLAVGISTIADRGIHYKPHFLLKLQTPDGNIIENTPTTLPPVEVPSNIWDLILKSLHEVISDPRGTAYHAGLDAVYAYAGKSGTAQVFSIKDYNAFKKNKNVPEALRDNSWFEAFAPVGNPQIAVAVLVEHNSEHQATYLAKQVLDAYLVKTPPTAPIKGSSS